MKFLNKNSIFRNFFRKIGDIVILNILFLICCIPLISIGSSLTALFYATLRMHRYHGKTSVHKDFLKGLKENFRQSTISWITLVILEVSLWVIIEFFINQTDASIIVYIFGAAEILPVILLIYLFPVIATFRHNLKNLVKHALYFAFSHIGYSICIAAIYFLPMYLTCLNPMPVSIFIWCLFGFALTAYLISFLMLKQFEKFLPKTEGSGTP